VPRPSWFDKLTMRPESGIIDCEYWATKRAAGHGHRGERAMSAPARFTNADALAADIIRTVGPNIVLALPLGLGKANHIANALYARAAQDRTIKLTIFTALTLEKPRYGSELERRFLEPVIERLFGAGLNLPMRARCGSVHCRRMSRSINSSSQPAAG